MFIDISQKFQPHLLPREVLLWCGQPRQGLTLRRADLFLVPFSLVWCSFVAFWTYMVIGIGAPLPFLVVGALFSLVGIYLLVGRFFVDLLVRRSTYYCVTNERILILTGFPFPKTESVGLATLTNLSLTIHPNQTGSIRFGPKAGSGFWSSGFRWPGASYIQGPHFEMINQAKAVYEIIERARREAEENPNR